MTIRTRRTSATAHPSRPRGRGTFAALAAATVLAVPVGAVALAGPASAVTATCQDATGQIRTATKVGTNASDYFSATSPNPAFRLVSGDVVAALGGDDVVDLTGLSGLLICFGDGNDRAVNGSSASGGFDARGEAGDDTFWTTPWQDRIFGGTQVSGDTVYDPAVGDADQCKNVETAVNCESVI
ncbi:hypothetical protein [Yinghuangia seranimata]|uniref:hypothetical protein n=1 Tax=Yinghuangia seranimata TaxID=408067 RepID=UPI00248AD1A7|nr:hypothetical protein [Yinghuangia seranimata]MDI2128320.1 hypothetical protein [Yinghuangia seranimata]